MTADPSVLPEESVSFSNDFHENVFREKAPLDAPPICAKAQMTSDTVSDALTRYEKQRILFKGTGIKHGKSIDFSTGAAESLRRPQGHGQGL